MIVYVMFFLSFFVQNGNFYCTSKYNLFLFCNCTEVMLVVTVVTHNFCIFFFAHEKKNNN